MTDKWREIPSTDRHAGLTELTRDGRSVACVGTGARVREAIVEAMENRLTASRESA